MSELRQNLATREWVIISPERLKGKSLIQHPNALMDAVEDMSGFAPELDWTLDQCGLSSVGLPQLAQRLQKALSSKSNPMPVSPATLSSARTVGDIVKTQIEHMEIENRYLRQYIDGGYPQ